MVKSNDNGFSIIVVELMTGLPLQSSAMIKYIIGLAISLGKTVLVTYSHIMPKPYCPYRYSPYNKSN